MILVRAQIVTEGTGGFACAKEYGSCAYVSVVSGAIAVYLDVVWQVMVFGDGLFSRGGDVRVI